MKFRLVGNGIGIPMTAVAVLLTALSLALPLSAQQGSSGGNAPQSQPQEQGPAKSATPGTSTPSTAVLAPAEVAKVDPAEEAAYKTFYEVNPDDVDTIIQLGEQFVKTYPSSKYDENVYTRLTQAYFNKHQNDQMFASGDKALAIDPDDVSVLVLIGWVIPHSTTAKDPESDRLLQKAEDFEDRALTVLAALPKPANLTDEQFAAAKADALSRAHSGLGLVYFRRNQLADSLKELELAVQNDSQSDPADYYVMGIDHEELKQYGDAADAFQKCAVIPWGMQDSCKQRAEAARKEAAAPPAKP